jgi:hypothetical protein
MTTKPVERATVDTSSASVAFAVKGFSHSTCFPALERLDGPLRVQTVRERHVDGVDAVIGDQVVVGAVHRRDAALGGHRLGPGGIARGDRDDLRGGVTACRLEERLVRDLGGAEATDPKGHASESAARSPASRLPATFGELRR